MAKVAGCQALARNGRGGAMDEGLRAQITREDIQEAIAALEQGESHPFGPSTFYDVLEDGRRYPPKAVVGLAARRVLGRTLRPDEFSGGEESWAFRLLRDRGFNVVKKPRSGDRLSSSKSLNPSIRLVIHGGGALQLRSGFGASCSS